MWYIINSFNWYWCNIFLGFNLMSEGLIYIVIGVDKEF